MRPSLSFLVPKIRYRPRTSEDRILEILNPVNYKNAKGGRVTQKSLRGVYQGAMLMKGTQVNRKDKNFPHYSTRWFKPNVQTKVLHSEVLDAKFKMPVTVKALKTIAQWGGFDNYLLNMDAKLLSRETTRLRDQIRATLQTYLDAQPEGSKILPLGITPGLHYRDRVRPVEFVAGDKLLKETLDKKLADPTSSRKGWKKVPGKLEEISGLAPGKQILGLEDFRK